MKKLFTLLLFIAIFAIVHAQQPGTWQSSGSNIQATPRTIFSVSVVDSSVIWGISAHPALGVAAREFTRTIDGGITWQSGIIDASNGGAFTALSICAINANIAWVIMTNVPSQNQGRIYKTTDGGQTWIQQTGSFNNSGNAITSIHFFDENNGITSGSPGTGNAAVDSLRIWLTANGGNTWERISKSQLPTTLPGEGIWLTSGSGAYDASGDTIWFGTRRGRVWRSINKGRTWNAFSTGIDKELYSVAFRDSKNGIVTSERLGLRTKDGGVTWETVTFPSTIDYGYYQIEDIPGTAGGYVLIYEGSSSYYNNFKMVYTLDNGNTWSNLDVPNGMWSVDFISPKQGWGGARILSSTNGGVYRWAGNFGITTATSEATDITTQIKLYPNPFTDRTVLEFELKDNTLPVEIIVTDVLGRTIKAWNLEKPNSGLNQLLLNIDASAGLLFLTLRQGAGVKTVKMIKQ
jgi:photosystem II stability/assembly factor-like uncharacterized protein